MIKSNTEDASYIVKGLKRLIPTNVECPNIKLVTESETVTPSNSTCILEKNVNSNYCCNWTGTLPKKCKISLQIPTFILGGDNFIIMFLL